MKNYIRVFALALIMVFAFSGCAKEERDYYTGSVESERVNVSAEVGGRIEKIYVSEGQSLKKGDLVCKIDSKDLELEKNRLESILEGSKSSLEKTKRGNRSEEIRKVRIQVDQQEKVIKSKLDEYNFKFDNFKKIESLFKEGGVSKQEYDNAVLQKDLSFSAHEAAKLQLKYLKEQLSLLQSGATKEDIEVSKSNYDASYWALKSVESRIEKTTIYANRDGVIQSINYDEGEVVQNYASIMAIEDVEKLWVKIYVEEKNLYKANLSDMVVLKVDYDENAKIEGRIVYISPRGEFTPKNIESKESKQEIVYQTKIDIIGGREFVKAGSLVDVYLGEDQDE